MDVTQLSPAKGDGIRPAGGVARVPDMPTSVLGGLSCHVWFCGWLQTRQRWTETSEPQSGGWSAQADGQHEGLSRPAQCLSWRCFAWSPS